VTIDRQSFIKVESHTAIMKGVVLYRLGMNERKLHANYGIAACQIFRQAASRI